jgi:hypothetical protein
MTTQTIGTVNVRVNTTPVARVRTIQYAPGATGTFTVGQADDVQFLNTANNLSVLTYDDTTDKFVVQNVPRLNGGTF